MQAQNIRYLFINSLSMRITLHWWLAGWRAGWLLYGKTKHSTVWIHTRQGEVGLCVMTYFSFLLCSGEKCMQHRQLSVLIYSTQWKKRKKRKRQKKRVHKIDYPWCFACGNDRSPRQINQLIKFCWIYKNSLFASVVDCAFAFAHTHILSTRIGRRLPTAGCIWIA